MTCFSHCLKSLILVHTTHIFILVVSPTVHTSTDFNSRVFLLAATTLVSVSVCISVCLTCACLCMCVQKCTWRARAHSYVVQCTKQRQQFTVASYLCGKRFIYARISFRPVWPVHLACARAHNTHIRCITSNVHAHSGKAGRTISRHIHPCMPCMPCIAYATTQHRTMTMPKC